MQDGQLIDLIYVIDQTKCNYFMKKITLFLFLSLSFSTFSQKYDARLEKNWGDTIATIFSKSHNYYNFLLFELDYSYELRTAENLDKNLPVLKATQFKNAAGKSLTKEVIQQGVFNFKEWGIVLKQNEPVVIQLDKTTYLYFYDKVSNNIRFAKSPLYTK